VPKQKSQDTLRRTRSWGKLTQRRRHQQSPTSTTLRYHAQQACLFVFRCACGSLSTPDQDLFDRIRRTCSVSPAYQHACLRSLWVHINQLLLQATPSTPVWPGAVITLGQATASDHDRQTVGLPWLRAASKLGNALSPPIQYHKATPHNSQSIAFR
jgi:hypothetical protein